MIGFFFVDWKKGMRQAGRTEVAQEFNATTATTQPETVESKA